MKELEVRVEWDVRQFLLKVVDACPDFDIYLGGGYLRDSYCSMKKGTYFEPKDVDIFFIPKDGVEKEVPVAAAESTFVKYHKAAADISDMEERGVSSLTGLSVHYLSTKEVQFIVYKQHMTQEQLVLDMDMNINGIMWKPVDFGGKALVSDAFISGHEEREIKCLHVYDETRMYYRYERMKELFPTYKVTGQPEEPLKKLKVSGLTYTCSVDCYDDYEG